MEHVVFSAAVDGVGEEFRRVANLDEAVRVVEHLRNDLGIEDAAVFALTPVPLAFRTYYRVEVPSAVAAPLALVSEPVSEFVAEPESEPAPSVAELEEVEPFEVPSLVPLMKSRSMEALESIAAIVGAESDDSADSADSEAEYDPEVHQLSELPATMAPGLEPRDESESEHSLGYFAR
jgi:hypothetical protein